VTTAPTHRRLPLLLAALGLGALVLLVAACDGGAGSSLSSCPASSDVVPGGACAMGIACPSAAALPDCPGSAGSLTCTCTKDGWTCADPTGSECHPDASDSPDASEAPDVADANVPD
jgi:hypothetical protein